jgi:DNA-binding transcriptional ArsR family regulator
MLNAIGKEIHAEFARNEEVCRHVIGLFQLMANKQRFRIVCILSRGKFCVNEIAAILGTDKLSNISQQLKVLRLAGVIQCERDSKRMIYSMSDDRIRDIIMFLKENYMGEDV